MLHNQSAVYFYRTACLNLCCCDHIHLALHAQDRLLIRGELGMMGHFFLDSDDHVLAFDSIKFQVITTSPSTQMLTSPCRL